MHGTDLVLNCASVEHKPLIKFPFAEENDFCFSFPYKLALIFGNKPIYERLFEDLALEHMRPFLLETICMIGLTHRTEDVQFKSLFKLKPWLFGENEPLMGSSHRVPELALKYYGQHAYTTMVLTLGSILIREQETSLFEQFFVSQMKVYMTDELASALV